MSDTVSADIVSKHPKGVRARVLLSVVFGPYAQDDEFGSRTINPMELFHNQVTRLQGVFRYAVSTIPGGSALSRKIFQPPALSSIFPPARPLPANCGQISMTL